VEKTEKKIILTDWPKAQVIDANLRGVEIDELLRLLKQMYHLMMGFTMVSAGGYYIEFDYKKVKEESKFRKVEIPHGYA
jgi:hypothetical protein